MIPLPPVTGWRVTSRLPVSSPVQCRIQRHRTNVWIKRSSSIQLDELTTFGSARLRSVTWATDNSAGQGWHRWCGSGCGHEEDVDADGLGGGDGKADGEDVAARDGDGTATGGGALVPG